MESDFKIDGSRIRALRLERRWERKQLAEIAHVSTEDLRRLESAGMASLETIRAVADTFGLEIHELLREPGSPGISAFIPPDLNSGTHSKPLPDSIPSLLLPYLPILRSALAASAFVLLAAFAIRLSPFVMEQDPQSELVESFEIFEPAQRAGVAAIEAELGTEILSDSEDPAANPRFAYSKPQAVSERVSLNLPAIPGNPADRVPALAEPIRRPDASSLPQAAADYWPTAESAISFHPADFTDLTATMDPIPEISLGVVASLNLSDSSQTGHDNVFELMARGTSTGFKTMGRSLAFSGKTTAAFFSKVGSSIKKAF